MGWLQWIGGWIEGAMGHGWRPRRFSMRERERRVIVVAEDEGGGNRGYGDHDVHKSW